jgi:pimeloyl-ACP methyl ester carboxylesterase
MNKGLQRADSAALSWSASAPAPLDPLAAGSDQPGTQFTAEGHEELLSFRTPVAGLERELLRGPAGVRGASSHEAATVTWAVVPSGVRCTVVAHEPGLRFEAPLAALDRQLRGWSAQTRVEAPAGVALVSLHGWPGEVDQPLLSPDGRPFRVDFRRAMALRASEPSSITRQDCWSVPLPPSRPVELSLTVRWPLVSDGDGYPTHDGGHQAWRLIVPADLDLDAATSGPLPLLVGLHGAANAADNWLRFSHPDWASSAKVLAAMVLGCPLIVPNFNDAASPEAEPERHPLPAGGGAKAEAYVWDAVAEAGRRYHLDPGAVYLLGLSLGGMQALGMAARHPDRVALVAAANPVTDPVATWSWAERQRPVHGILNELADGLGARLPEGRVTFLQHSPLWLAENLANTHVFVRGSRGDELVDGDQHTGRFSSALESFGAVHSATVTPVGSHGDYFTVEGAYDDALPLLCSRPSVDPSPHRVAFRTADLRWRRAHWIELTELGAPTASVHAAREVVANRVILRTSGVTSLLVDADQAQLDVDTLDVVAECDEDLTVEVVSSHRRRTIQCAPTADRLRTAPEGPTGRD